MSGDISVRPATAADFERAGAWLAEAGLPSEDLTPAHMQDFLVAIAAGVPVGMVGLQQFGAVGLLRSLVVDTRRRRAGLGRQLVAALEAQAAGSGVRELWLLTIDAQGYFATLGYALRERSDAPAAIRATPEFASLCPGDAFLMSKRC